MRLGDRLADLASDQLREVGRPDGYIVRGVLERVGALCGRAGGPVGLGAFGRSDRVVEVGARRFGSPRDDVVGPGRVDRDDHAAGPPRSGCVVRRACGVADDDLVARRQRDVVGRHDARPGQQDDAVGEQVVATEELDELAKYPLLR